VVISTLRQIRGTQPPEAQQRIDLILKQLDKDNKTTKPAAGAGAGGGGPQPPAIFDAPQFEHIDG
jgi:hypothetical protein